MRSGKPQPTLLAKMLKEIAEGKSPDDFTAEEPGWWHKPERIHYSGPEFTQKFMEQPGEAPLHYIRVMNPDSTGLQSPCM